MNSSTDRVTAGHAMRVTRLHDLLDRKQTEPTATEDSCIKPESDLED
jgi:hypothetical protein